MCIIIHINMCVGVRVRGFSNIITLFNIINGDTLHRRLGKKERRERERERERRYRHAIHVLLRSCSYILFNTTVPVC